MSDLCKITIDLTRKPGWWFRVRFWISYLPIRWRKHEDSNGLYRIEYWGSIGEVQAMECTYRYSMDRYITRVGFSKGVPF